MIRFFAAIFLASCVLLLVPAAASAQIAIVSTQLDLATNVLTVTGSPLAPGIRAFLFVNGLTELPVVSVAATQLKATLPTNIAPGSYLLLLFQPSNGRSGTFTASIHAGTPVVVDNQARVIGPPLAGSAVLAKSGEDVFSVVVTPNGFPVSNVNLIFFQADCSGAAYRTFAPSIPLIGSVTGTPPYGTTAWIPDVSVPEFTPTPDTVFYYSDVNGVCNFGGGTGGSFQQLRSVDLSGFTPPFKVSIQ